MVSKKFFILAVFAVLSIGMLVFFNTFAMNYFKKNNEIIANITALEHENIWINFEVLNSSFFLYQNFDNLLARNQNSKNLVKSLSDNSYILENYENIPTYLDEIKALLNEKERLITRFQTLNSSIKNSVIYLSTVLDQSTTTFKNKEYLHLVSDITASIYLSKNSFDSDFLIELDEKIAQLKAIPLNSKREKELNEIFLAHLKVYQTYFRDYVDIINQILNDKVTDQISLLNRELSQLLQNKIKIISAFSIVFTALFLASLVFIIVLIFKLNSKNRSYEHAYEELSLSLKTDTLTEFLNRYSLQKDVLTIDYPILILFNIDGFKHYNDLYGNTVGNFILKESARYIKKISRNYLVNERYYRVGADEFAILFDKKENLNVDIFLDKILKYIKKFKLDYNSIAFKVDFTISMSDSRPILETADMALKYAKKNKLNFTKFHPTLSIKDDFEHSMVLSNNLKNALESSNVVPFYQPIIDNKTNKIFEYEALARIKHKNKFESIYPYLVIAKELKLYESLTIMVYKKTFEYFKDKDVNFSLNLSMSNVKSNDILEFVYGYLRENKEQAQKVTFEVLESEAIDNYPQMKNFVDKVHSFGAKIAIDDFGSGYSNFVEVLKFNVDYIKIDGSIIKDIDTSENARLITKTIVNFAKEAGIKTIAEYVHSKEVLDVVKELGVDYSQGFYFQAASKHILDHLYMDDGSDEILESDVKGV
jgi:diguanylate cyclase (GGDEF)-like protein